MPNENKEISTIEQAVALTGRKSIEFFSDKSNVQPLIDKVVNDALSLVPVVDTKKGRDAIGSTALNVSKSRGLIEDAIDNASADLKAKLSSIKDVKDHVITSLNQARKDVLAPRDEWNAEQKRKEDIRIEAIKEKIAGIATIGDFAEDDTTETISNKIDALENIDITIGFDEFTAGAAKAIQEATGKLHERIVKIANDKKAEEQRVQLEAEKKKNLIQERLSNLTQIPLSLMGKSSSEIKRRLDAVGKSEITDDEFDERSDEAREIRTNVLQQLEFLQNQALSTEATEKAKAEEVIQPPSEAEKVINDAVQLGTGVMMDGKRVNPADIQIEVESHPLITGNAKPATEEHSGIKAARDAAFEAFALAEEKWNDYTQALPDGDEKTRALAIYENILLVTRV